MDFKRNKTTNTTKKVWNLPEMRFESQHMSSSYSETLETSDM